MDIDLIDAAFDLSSVSPQELEECLSDPFALRFLPDEDPVVGQSRYYLIGQTLHGRQIFLCFATDGKIARIFAARDVTENENRFYNRKLAEF